MAVTDAALGAWILRSTLVRKKARLPISCGRGVVRGCGCGWPTVSARAARAWFSRFARPRAKDPAEQTHPSRRQAADTTGAISLLSSKDHRRHRGILHPAQNAKATAARHRQAGRDSMRSAAQPIAGIVRGGGGVSSRS